MKRTKTQKGITLVALIITIIVLLILAVVTIGSIQNEGIIQKASDAKTKYSEAQAKEKVQLGIQEYMLDHNGGFEADDFVSKLGDYVAGATGTGTSITVDGYTFEISTVGTVTKKLEPGLYDANGVMTKSWDELVAEKQDAVVNNEIVEFGFGETGLIVGKLVIPSYITRIGGSAFLCEYGLTEIVIPDGITVIEGHTFNSCDSLTRITLPNSITNINENAFIYDNDLEVIYKGTKEEWNEITIHNDAFYCGTVTVKCTNGTVTIDGSY